MSSISPNSGSTPPSKPASRGPLKNTIPDQPGINPGRSSGHRSLGSALGASLDQSAGAPNPDGDPNNNNAGSNLGPARSGSPRAAVLAPETQQNPYLHLSKEQRESRSIQAAKKGDLNTLRLLELAGVDFAVYNNAPAKRAAENGHVPVLEFLDGKPGVDFAANNNELASLAAENGHVPVLEFLDGKPGVDFADNNNRAAINAAEHRHIPALEFLDGKPGVDFADNNNLLAKMAGMKGDIGVLEFLDGKPGVDFAVDNNEIAKEAGEERDPCHYILFFLQEHGINLSELGIKLDIQKAFRQTVASDLKNLDFAAFQKAGLNLDQILNESIEVFYLPWQRLAQIEAYESKIKWTPDTSIDFRAADFVTESTKQDAYDAFQKAFSLTGAKLDLTGARNFSRRIFEQVKRQNPEKIIGQPASFVEDMPELEAQAAKRVRAMDDSRR